MQRDTIRQKTLHPIVLGAVFGHEPPPASAQQQVRPVLRTGMRHAPVPVPAGQQHPHPLRRGATLYRFLVQANLDPRKGAVAPQDGHDVGGVERAVEHPQAFLFADGVDEGVLPRVLRFRRDGAERRQPVERERRRAVPAPQGAGGEDCDARRIMDGASCRPGTPFRSGGRSSGWIAFAGSLPVNVRPSMINGVSASILAGSIGLAALGYFDSGITSVLVEKGYSRIRGAEPIIRAKFDVHLVENHLIYFKTPCAPSDKRETFFLQVVPTDVNALPEGLPRKRGFEHRDYYVSVRLDATHAGGRCMAVVPLPEYDVAAIRTGQYTRNG